VRVHLPEAYPGVHKGFAFCQYLTVVGCWPAGFIVHSVSSVEDSICVGTADVACDTQTHCVQNTAALRDVFRRWPGRRTHPLMEPRAAT